MRDFADLYFAIDATNSTNEKASLLERYFRDADPRDGAWAVALIAGERPKSAASSRVLRDLARQVTGLPDWLIDESYGAVGDLSETIALLIDVHTRGRGGSAGSNEPLHAVMERRVLPLALAGEAERRAMIRQAWEVFSAGERLVYHKLIRGGFRIGVQKRILTRSLATLTGLDHGVIAQRLAGKVLPTSAYFASLVDTDPSASDDASRPYPFFLAHPLDAPAESLGDPGGWQAEWKWDGIRAQLIRRAGEPILWSRGEEVITHQFPGIIDSARRLEPCVLDGEVLMWRGDRPMPFAELQKRLNRVVAPTHQLSLFDGSPRAVFLAYDLLERGGVDLRLMPLRDRRSALERVLGDDGSSFVRRSPILEAASWDELAALREESIARGTEGLMLKRADSTYGIGRTKGDGGAAWWKWKIDPFTVDAVLVASQLGSGRRASLHTDHTFALWSETDGGGRELVTFAKAYSGLSNDEIERLDTWVRANTTGRAGPVRFVEPAHVFEIAFEGLRESSRHKAGIAVRFPRILKWRTDKAPGEADTIASLRALLAEVSV